MGGLKLPLKPRSNVPLFKNSQVFFFNRMTEIMRLSKNHLRLTRVENLRDKLEDLDRSAPFLPSVFGRDGGCRQAMDLLDEIEMGFRKQMVSDQGRELLKVMGKTVIFARSGSVLPGRSGR